MKIWTEKPDLGSNSYIILETEKLDCLTDLKAHLNTVVSVIGIRIRAPGDTVVTVAKRCNLKMGFKPVTPCRYLSIRQYKNSK